MITAPCGDTVAGIRCSTRAHGDFHLDGNRDALRARRRAFVEGCWSQPDEVHGTVVRHVTRLGEHDFAVADALVTLVPGAVLGIWVGDCAPVALVSRRGAVGAAHAGWRGALEGVLDATVAAFAALGHPASALDAYLGPCIHPCCYEFGEADLARMVGEFGPTVAATTAWGTPALDVPALVAVALGRHGIHVTSLSRCTGCHAERYWSHRRRAERQRQVMAVWMQERPRR